VPKPREYERFLSDERELALRSTRLLGESGLGLSFDPDLSYDVLDALDGERFRRLFVVKFRGSGKTTEIAAWLTRKIARNRDFRALVVSVDDEKATEIVDMTRKFLETPRLCEWFTPFENRRLWSMDAFEVLGRSRPFREPTVTAAGMRSFRAGGHYNCIVVDDGEDDEWTNSGEKMEATRKREALLAPMCDVGESLRIDRATFWNDMDLTMSLLRTYGLVHEERAPDKSIRRIIRNGERVNVPLSDGSVYPVQVFYKPVEDEAGNPLFPKARSAEWIAAKKMEMRLQPDLYAAQYRLDPIAVETAQFQPQDFRFCDSLPKDVRGDYWCGGDFASSLKPGSDHSAFVVCMVTEDFHFYVVEAFSKQMNGLEAIETLFTLHQSYPGIRFALEEDRYAAGLKVAIEEQMRQRRILLDIEWINAHARTKKESRVEGTTPVFKQGWVTFLTGRADPLYDSLRRHPKGRRDLPDAWANIYEVVQAAPPARKEEALFDERDLFPVVQRRGNEQAPSYAPTRIKRLTAEEVPWHLL
jgi:hypothetical protein